MSTIQIDVGKFGDNQDLIQAINRAAMLIIADAEEDDRKRNMVYGPRGSSADAVRDWEEKAEKRRQEHIRLFGSEAGFRP